MSTVCYTQNNGTIYTSSGQVPCGTGTGVRYCCEKGDQCGGSGFCHFSHAQDVTVTGFYLGGCTDRTHSDAICPQHCGGVLTQDVVYSSSNSLWKCCYGNGSLNCDFPSVESFLGPSPDDILAAIAASTTLGAAATTKSSSTISTVSSSSSPASFVSVSAASTSVQPSSSSATTQSPISTATKADASSVSTAAGAVIAPAVIVPIVAIVGGLIALLWYRRRRHARAPAASELGTSDEKGHFVSELSARPAQAELDTGNDDKYRYAGELAGDHASELDAGHYKSTGNAHAAELAG